MTGAGVRHADRFDLGQLVARDGPEVSEAGYLQFSIPRVETPLVVYVRAVDLARPLLSGLRPRCARAGSGRPAASDDPDSPLRARTLLPSRCLRPVPAP